jgi:formyl-CoA transferase
MLPLSGITVISVEQAVAAPFCTSRLADAGARVIKVERPEGDFARGYDDVARGQSIHFVWLNRGKESVVLDLTKEADRAHLEQFIARADVLVQNLKSGAFARLGFPIERLRRDYPALICCSISGYGDSGPLAQRKAYDLLVQAESGLASITGGPEGPARVGISIVDISTGATAHAAILEALIARGRTGQGSDIRISMFDVMADWLAMPLLHAEGGLPPQRVGLAHPSIAPYGAFASKDGVPILISIQNDREWVGFCREVLRKPEAAADPRFATTVARFRNRPETDGMVRDTFASLTREELVARLTAADTAFAEVNDMAALSAHPHLRRTTVDTPAGRISLPPPGPLFDGASRPCGAVPALGADTERVLAEFGRKSEVGSPLVPSPLAGEGSRSS